MLHFNILSRQHLSSHSGHIPDIKPKRKKKHPAILSRYQLLASFYAKVPTAKASTITRSTALQTLINCRRHSPLSSSTLSMTANDHFFTDHIHKQSILSPTVSQTPTTPHETFHSLWMRSLIVFSPAMLSPAPLTLFLSSHFFQTPTCPYTHHQHITPHWHFYHHSQAGLGKSNQW